MISTQCLCVCGYSVCSVVLLDEVYLVHFLEFGLAVFAFLKRSPAERKHYNVVEYMM